MAEHNDQFKQLQEDLILSIQKLAKKLQDQSTMAEHDDQIKQLKDDLTLSIQKLIEKQLIEQLRENVQKIAEEEKERTIAKHLRWIVKTNPEHYAGERDPVILENWIAQFDKLFDLFDYPVERRVTIAVYYLKGVADYWWKDASKKDYPNFGWDDLKAALRERFCPLYVRMKNVELYELKQLSMSVTEYYSKFLELERTMVASTSVPDEDYRVWRFMGGLTWRLQSMMCLQTTPTTLHEAYEKADRLYMVNAQFLPNRKRNTHTGGNNLRNNKRQKFNGN